MLLEEVANKEGIQGKYLPCMISSVIKVCRFITLNETSIPQKSDPGSKMNLLELFLYDKLNKRSVKAFINSTGALLKSFDLLYRRSEYRDYILDTSVDSLLTKCTKSAVFTQHLSPSLKPLLSTQPVLKTVLQLQKVQKAQILTFKAEKIRENKEEKEEKKLRKEVKKAFRDAKRELKKDSEAIHRVRQEETEKRERRNALERKRVRRILEQESSEFKAMRSQEMQKVKTGPKAQKLKRMAGNKTEKN